MTGHSPRRRPRIGSLCAGYGGLDLAVLDLLGGRVVWHAEIDPAACTVLAWRWPATPNHGDLRRVDWSTVTPVDVLTAGYPCQPFSPAGHRKGEHDERHLWPDVRRAVRVLRPRLVLLENVAAHLGLGFDRVLGDLAGIGYDTVWCCLPAAEIGAAHTRRRVFVAAHPTGQGRPFRRPAGPDPDPPPAQRGPGLAATPSADGATGAGPDSGAGGGPVGRFDGGFDWRQFTPAIRRWEAVHGPAPVPAALAGPRGGLNSNPVLVEWLMGLPRGWVSEVAGLDDAARLHLLGNGVMPAQARHALTWLLEKSAQDTPGCNEKPVVPAPATARAGNENRCAACRAPVIQPAGRGRRRRYCGDACRVRGHRARRLGQNGTAA